MCIEIYSSLYSLVARNYYKPVPEFERMLHEFFSKFDKDYYTPELIHDVLQDKGVFVRDKNCPGQLTTYLYNELYL